MQKVTSAPSELVLDKEMVLRAIKASNDHHDIVVDYTPKIDLNLVAIAEKRDIPALCTF